MAVIFRFIGGFLKTTWSAISFLRVLFFNLLFLGLLVFIFYAFLDTEPALIKDDSILQLTISGAIVEQRSQRDLIGDYAGRMLGVFEKPRETVLQDIVDVIHEARDDSRISALLLDLKYLESAGLNQLQTIGAALEDFKTSSKPVICAEDYLNQSQYYLAAHADSLFLNPMGGVNLHGLGLYRFYFKDALEKLKINFHVFQVGSYKSALEPITRNSMSAEDRSQSREWLSTLWNNYTADVADQRSIKPADIDSYINSIPENLKNVGGDTAKLALQYELVDTLMTRAEVRAFLALQAGSDEQGQVNMVSFDQYLSQVEPSFQGGSGTDQIGLIVAQGTIVASQSQPGTIGSETLSRQFRNALEDDRIKAVVLRIDSGGGSAFASEIIRQEILNFKNSNKPLVVSMGTYAASGGYWIAADADEIWASPTTLTGSIGIFMAIPTFEDVMTKAGIHRDGVGTTNLSSGLDISRPLSEEVRGAIEATLHNGYDRFISVVADGRDLDRDRVEQLAQGRVYAGAQAQELGLVDNLGTLEQAIRAAAERAGLADFGVTAIQTSTTWWERLFPGSGARLRLLLSSTPLGSELLTQLEPLFDSARSFLIFPDPNGMYAHCMINYIQ